MNILMRKLKDEMAERGKTSPEFLGISFETEALCAVLARELKKIKKKAYRLHEISMEDGDD